MLINGDLPGFATTICISPNPCPHISSCRGKLRFEAASRADLLRSDVGHGHCHFDMAVPPYFSKNTLHYSERTYLQLNIVQNKPGT